MMNSLNVVEVTKVLQPAVDFDSFESRNVNLNDLKGFEFPSSPDGFSLSDGRLRLINKTSEAPVWCEVLWFLCPFNYGNDFAAVILAGETFTRGQSWL
jgi:hypothetical protein